MIKSSSWKSTLNEYNTIISTMSCLPVRKRNTVTLMSRQEKIVNSAGIVIKALKKLKAFCFHLVKKYKNRRNPFLLFFWSPIRSLISIFKKIIVFFSSFFYVRCAKSILRVGGLHWPKSGATHYNTQ